MSDWKQYYKERCISVEEAMKKVKSGDKIVDGHGCARAEIFTPELVKRADELKNVKIAGGSTYGNVSYLDPKYKDSFTFYSLFDSGEVRKAHWEGRAEFVPMPFSQQDAWMKYWEPDILFTGVTPPDENGNVSLSLSVDYTRAALDAAKMVIVQVNDQLPWTYGDAVVPVTEIDYFVEASTKPFDIPVFTEVNPVEKKIAENVASLINDGDVLQIGTGTIPDQILNLITDRKHIGLHTELGTYTMMKLIDAGVVDNSTKILDKGISVFTVIGGNEDFYKWLDHNDRIVMRRSSYVTNPMVIAQQKNFCAINSAIEIDLYGQVAADMMGNKQFSGVGGQLDFMRGAQMSEGGRSVIAMTSTAARGKVSRITARLKEGAAVTDTRFDSRYIVTEYGIADMWGKTVRERAEALISIAHPDFREQLAKDFEEMYINVL